MLDADADRVNLRAERGGELRRRQRINRLCCFAVGQQNDDPAFALRQVLQSLGRHRDGVADGRAEFLQAADVQALEMLDQPVVIQRERAGQIRHGGKHHQPDAIARAFVDEILEHVARDAEAGHAFARPAHIERHHGPRKIEREHEVQPGRFGFHVRVRQPRHGQR